MILCFAADSAQVYFGGYVSGPRSIKIHDLPKQLFYGLCNLDCFPIQTGSKTSAFVCICCGQSLRLTSAMSASQVSESPDLSSVAGTSALEMEGPAKDMFNAVILGSAAELDQGQDPDSEIVKCQECSRDTDISKAQKIGSNKLGRKTSILHKCNECNALQMRMQRIFARRAALANDWSSLSADEKKDFVARSHALKGEELENQVEAQITMIKEQSTTLHTGAAGEFHPLSVWMAKGLTEEHCKALEKNAPKKWCPLLNDYTYQRMVESSGHVDKETIKNIASYQAAARDRRPSAEGQTPSKKAKDDKDKGGKALQRKTDLELKAKLRADSQAASKIISSLAPLISTGKLVMGGKILLPAVSSKLPDSVVQDARTCLRKLEIVDAAWKEVLGGTSPPIDADMQVDAIALLKKTATKTFQSLSTMIKLLE